MDLLLLGDDALQKLRNSPQHLLEQKVASPNPKVLAWIRHSTRMKKKYMLERQMTMIC
jgi:hypothetical protein